jgi:hypothetical protein
MGKNNQQRRAAKKRRSQGTGGQSGRAGGGSGRGAARARGVGPTPFDGFDANGPNPFAGMGESQLHDIVVGTTSDVFWREVCADPERVARPQLVAEVARYHEELRPPEREAVLDTIAHWVHEELDAVWERHWTPDDLAQSARRNLDAADATFLAAVARALSVHHAKARFMPAEWRHQLDAFAAANRVPAGVGAGASFGLDGSGRWLGACGATLRLEGAALWAGSLRLVRLFVRLPLVNELVTPPSRWSPADSVTHGATDHVDAKLLDRVRALLAKAESTTFTEEADALTAKAQELMSRHAIDQAFIHHADRDAKPTPQLRRFWLDNPYVDAKSTLLGRVAAANRCQSVFDPSLGVACVVGFATDLDVVDVLFTSLLIQGSTAVQAAGSVTDGRGRSRTRSFRSSFWMSYAVHIGERLTAASEAAVAEAVGDHGGSLLPVLVERDAEVADRFAQAFPNVTRRSVQFSNAQGYHAGRLAAEAADLGTHDPLTAPG